MDLMQGLQDKNRDVRRSGWLFGRHLLPKLTNTSIKKKVDSAFVRAESTLL